MSCRLATLAAAILMAVAAPAAHALDTVRIGTPALEAFVFSLVGVGTRSGIFEKNGFDVKRVDFAGGAKLHQAMAAGELDIAVGTGTDMLFVIRGAPEKGVAAYGNDLGVSIVARPDNTVRAIDDLKGKTLGTTTTGSFTSWVARQIAVNHGWGPEGIRLAYLGSMPAIVAALETKNVDAIVATNASALLLESQHRGRIIVRATDEIHDYIADVLYASDAMMKDHPDELRRFIKAWFETAKFAKTHRAETIRMVEPDMQMPEAIAGKIYDEEAKYWFTDGHFDRKDFAVVKQSLIDIGVVKSVPSDDRLYTEKFLPR